MCRRLRKSTVGCECFKIILLSEEVKRWFPVSVAFTSSDVWEE